MGQTSSSLFTTMESTCQDGSTEELDSQLLQTRQCLLSAIKLGSDCSGPLMDLLYLPCPVTMKYAVLNVRDILKSNNQTVQSLRNIPVALNILEKYGRHLIKPKSVRNELWRYVKFSNPIFRDRVDPLQGGRELMKAMGYTKEIEDGLLFPEHQEPDMDRTANMVADIILAKKEMEMYLSGTHPHPQAIEKFLPLNIVSDVQMLRVGVSMNELASPNAALSQEHVPHYTQSAPDAAEGDSTMKLCDICGDQTATKLCMSCDYKLLCSPCDQMWHTHPRRQNHRRDITTLSGVNVNQHQTDTIQGPYGIQARPLRDGAHQKITAQAAVPVDSQETDKTASEVQSFHKELLLPCLGSKLSSPLRNIPKLDSLVLSRSSLGNIMPGDLQSTSVLTSPVSHKLSDSTSEQIPAVVHKAVEPLSVYFPPKSITQPVPSVHSSTSQPAEIQRSDSVIFSKLLSRIKEEENVEKQMSKCDIDIISLSEEIEEIEKRVHHIVEANENFFEDEEFMKLNRKKGFLMREKIMLEKYRLELKSSCSDTVTSSSVPLFQTGYASPSSVSSKQDFSPQPRPPIYKHLGAPNLQMTMAASSERYSDSVVEPTDSSCHSDENVNYSAVLQPRTTNTTQTPHSSDMADLYGTTKFIQPYLDHQQAFALPDLWTVKTVSSAGLNMTAHPQEAAQTCVTTTDQNVTTISSQKGKKQKSDVSELHAVHKMCRWQCEHCTMFNDISIRICEMCHRTSDNPTFVEESNVSPESLSDRQVEFTGEGTQVISAGVPDIGRKIAQEQDQIYQEKKEAHRQYQEQLKREADGKMCKGYNQLAPVFQSDQESKPRSSTAPSIQKKENVDHSYKQLLQPSREVDETTVGIEGSGHSFRQATFQETMENINEQRHVKKTQLDGADLLQILKTADHEGFNVEEVLVALEHCDREPKAAFTWLQTSWKGLIERVVNMVTSRSQECEQNNIGMISRQEAKLALQECRGHVEEAASHCVKARIKLYADVNKDGVYARENVLEAMCEHEGHRENVQRHLDTMCIGPFKDRIWQDSESYESDIVQLTLSPNYNSVSTSVISHQDFQAMVCNADVDLERRIRMVLVEARLQSWGRAETVIKILEQDLLELQEENDYSYTLEDVVEAVRNCQDRRSSVIYLQRECIICLSKFPMTKMMNLNICQCQMCRECLRKHFEISIKEKHVRAWTCPVCSLPDFNDENVSADYLNLLGLMLKTFVDRDIQDLFETKVRDWHLQKDPNFRWCAHCGNGFLYQGWQDGRGQLCMFCQQCKKSTCFLCKKQWEPQHEGLSCEQFEQWKIDNDPNNQAFGLAKLLEESGIDCPSCKMRYSLAKGGCMHFKCPECAHEFCSGCSQPFYKQGVCHRFKQCTSQGLHCHHPRDCFFYLRDNDIDELQQLLKLCNVQFNTDNGQESTPVTCPVMELKDGEVGFQRDEPCGKEVIQGSAGLCCVHYKEYLVALINRHKLDPIIIMSQEQMQRLITRMELPLQKRKEKESQTQFKKRLLTFIKENLPLKR